MKKSQLRHNYYWLDGSYRIAYCHTCKKEVYANTAYHFRFNQQSTLMNEILESKE